MPEDRNVRRVLTISFPTDWLKELKRKAIEISSEKGETHTHIDLIRLAVLKEYDIDPGRFAVKKPEIYGELKKKKRIKR